MCMNSMLILAMQGTYLVMQAATKMMVERKISSGSIINMSSILAKVKIVKLFLSQNTHVGHGTK